MKNRIFQAMEIPADMKKGVSLTEISGYQEIRVENFRSICSYTDNRIRILASGYIIGVEGSCLKIAYYGENFMRITGKICAVTFDRN